MRNLYEVERKRRRQDYVIVFECRGPRLISHTQYKCFECLLSCAVVKYNHQHHHHPHAVVVSTLRQLEVDTAMRYKCLLNILVSTWILWPRYTEHLRPAAYHYWKPREHLMEVNNE